MVELGTRPGHVVSLWAAEAIGGPVKGNAAVALENPETSSTRRECKTATFYWHWVAQLLL